MKLKLKELLTKIADTAKTLLGKSSDTIVISRWGVYVPGTISIPYSPYPRALVMIPTYATVPGGRFNGMIYTVGAGATSVYLPNWPVDNSWGSGFNIDLMILLIPITSG